MIRRSAPLAAAPPAPTSFGWTGATLGRRVDTGTAEQLATYDERYRVFLGQRRR